MALSTNQDVAIRKRQQIAQSKKMMFIWIAAASVLLGFAAVAGYFLVQKGLYNQQVINKQSESSRTLTANLAAADELINQIRARNTSEALRNVMAPGQSEPIRVVLDALPDTANSSAFGSSLQKRFLDRPGVKIEALSVDPVSDELPVGEEGVEDASAATLEEEGAVENTIGFSFSVSTSANELDKLRDLLVDIERSIRTVHVTNLRLERQGNRYALSVEGYAYYQPAVTTDLHEEEVPLKGAKQATATTDQEAN